ncbi:MAG: rhodanese-like domain-containing protein [Alistipes sp.]|jgi:rhodanese-related sulfurtransferase|nr:rhodanese-like domain-containing protein [Alistipes sp.]
MNFIKICVAVVLATIAIYLLSARNNKGSLESVNTARFAEVVAQPDVQIVDVRTAAEFEEGHILGAVNMDVKSHEFDNQIKSLDKKKVVALYCRSGRRSKIAAEKVAALGCTVVELDGGILSWNGEIER